MNSTVPRNCWKVLAVKAEASLDACRERLNRSQARQSQLQASQQRLNVLMDEYRQRQTQAQQDGQSMKENLDHRRFMDQMQQLADKLALDLQHATHQCQMDRKGVVAAEQERDRMRKLVEQDLAQVRAVQAKTEQRRHDEQAIMRFQWREI